MLSKKKDVFIVPTPRKCLKAKKKDHVKGLSFHKDENFDTEDIFIYSPKQNGDGRLTFHQHSLGGDSALFSVEIPAGTVTRFEGMSYFKNNCFL